MSCEQKCKVSINTSSEVPRIEKVSHLAAGTGFWCKRYGGFRIIVGPNCSRDRVLEGLEADENCIVYYDVSLQHIGTMPIDTEVVVATGVTIEFP